MSGALFAKLFKVSNYQARAVSLETGLRNSGLAMTLAILIQDRMGDFYSSMFVVSGVFGLGMYMAGITAVLFFKKLLPIPDKQFEDETLVTKEILYEET